MLKAELKKPCPGEVSEAHPGESERVRLLSENDCREEELTLRLSLYRVTLEECDFYAVASRRVDGDRTTCAAELLGQDRRAAESIYQRLVRGAVSPTVLHEIVFDLTD